MRTLLVKNWAQYQHYKKRSPAWIKLHRLIVEDYAFAALKDKTKAHLMLIWVMASATGGQVPYDPLFIAKRINATESVDLDAMIAAGFLLPQDGEELPAAPARVNGARHAIADTGDVIERIPMIGGEEFEVRQSFVEEMDRLYLNVDIPLTLKEMRGWCLGNPTKLKTPRGIRKFIVSWLQREQDKNGRA